MANESHLDLDLSKCEVRIKTTKSRKEDKVSRKISQKCEDGTIVWGPEEREENLKGLPVRMRYGSALLMSFKDSSLTSGLKRAGRKALAVLWLRDIADNDER